MTTIAIKTATPIFVYGTLRPGEGNYNWALIGRTTNERTGFLRGTSMYTNGGFPYVIEEADGNGVVGTLVDIDIHDVKNIMECLDCLEGTHNGDEVEGVGKMHRSNLYNRVLRTIEVEDGTEVEAWVYLPPVENNERIRNSNIYVKSGDWMDGRNIRFGYAGR